LNLQTNITVVQLLKIEWLKLKSYSAFIVISLFFMVGILASNYIVFSFKKNVVDKADPIGLVSSSSPYDFDFVWQTCSYVSGWLLLLPGLVLIMLVTNEFTFRTHRQNIIDGWSRFQFLKVKLATAVIFAVGSTLVVIITALIFGFSSGSAFSFNGFENVGYFLLKAVTYNMVGLLIALLAKKSGVAIALFFIYTIFENGVSMMLFFLAVKLKTDSNLDLTNLGNYLPMNAADGLLTSPLEQFSGIAGKFIPSDNNMLVLAFAIAYVVLFYLWSRRKMLKADL